MYSQFKNWIVFFLSYIYFVIVNVISCDTNNNRFFLVINSYSHIVLFFFSFFKSVSSYYFLLLHKVQVLSNIRINKIKIFKLCICFKLFWQIKSSFANNVTLVSKKTVLSPTFFLITEYLPSSNVLFASHINKHCAT